jgi:HTH-type transcriptional regulator/antitoxin HigA
MANELDFAPDWVSPPGDTISDLLEERDWSQGELAARLECSEKHISLLLNGKASITQEMALKLERVLGSTADFWLKRESQYREQLARIEEREKLNTWIDWAKALPVKDLMDADALVKRRLDAKNWPEIVDDLLRFFGVASPESWKAMYEAKQLAFRRTRSDQCDIGAITAWLRMGEIQAEKQDGPNFDKTKFQAALRSIREMTVLPPQRFASELHRLCWSAGVHVVLVPAIPKSHVCGVARWLNPHKALIQMSLYGRKNDKFWFTFFHEAAHILKHDKKDVFLDALEVDRSDSPEEEEANQWARDILIPPRWAADLRRLKTKAAVRQFAAQINLHPGIVVGRLQYDGFISNSWMNDLKDSLVLQRGTAVV